MLHLKSSGLYTLTPEPGRGPTRVRAKSLSASEIEVSWKALPWNASKKRVLGYEVSYTEVLFVCASSGFKCAFVQVCVCVRTRSHKHRAAIAVESCSPLLLMSVLGSCTLGIGDNSLLHA